MSWEPENKRSNGSYAADYSTEEAAVVDHAKRVHKETTASAQRALKVLIFLHNPGAGLRSPLRDTFRLALTLHAQQSTGLKCKGVIYCRVCCTANLLNCRISQVPSFYSALRRQRSARAS